MSSRLLLTAVALATLALAACTSDAETGNGAPAPRAEGEPSPSSSANGNDNAAGSNNGSGRGTGSSNSPGNEVDLGTASDEGRQLSVHTTLGIPENAVVDDPEHALLVKKEYVTSYDSLRKNPRWTSWEVSSTWLGTAGRSTTFRADPDLSATLVQAASSDYSKSGFQQGHICPSADRTSSDAVNQATFVFTNVVPQTAASNLGSWKSLETEERALVAAGEHVFVIAGPLYATERTIGAGVSVPSSMFKVVVALHGDHPVAGDVTTNTRVIAVDIPNTDDVSGSYRNYRTTLADLESRTGFHLLSDVAPGVHEALRTAVDTL